MKIIEDNWEVIDTVEKLAKIKSGDKYAGFARSKFFLGDTQRGVPLNVEYKKKNKRGEDLKKTDSFTIYAYYCPFTGKPLYEESADQSEKMKEVYKKKVIENEN